MPVTDETVPLPHFWRPMKSSWFMFFVSS